jgi:hypothetical protein
MILVHGTDRLESTRLVLRRMTPDDLPFCARIHALREVAQDLYPGSRPCSSEGTAAWDHHAWPLATPGEARLEPSL